MVKQEKDMNLQEYKNYFFQSQYYKSLGSITHLLTMLYVIQWQFVQHPLNGWRYKRRINPYNPLSYLYVIISLMVNLVYHLFATGIPLVVREIIRGFKWN